MTDHVYVRDVFVAGKFPRLTYNPRDDKHLESNFRLFLNDEGKCLVVSGPSKAGKTVLVEKLLPEQNAVWVNGAHIKSANDLWVSIVDQLGLFTAVERTEESGESIQAGVGVEFTAVFVKVSGDARPTVSSGTRTTQSRESPPQNVVAAELESKPVPIVIDDFHYIEHDVRVDIARSVKDLIRRTPVVLIAVPHEAFEPVRQEREMDFRVWNLAVTPWDTPELLEIAKDGFGLLNLVDSGDNIGLTLARNSLGAPFLMQQMCRDFVTSRGIVEKPVEVALLSEPEDWDVFFAMVANRYEPSVFRSLLRGPPTRGTERVSRKLHDGRATDIYGAVFFALSQMTETQNIGYRAIALKIGEFFDQAPRSGDITNALNNIAEIAKDNRQNGDPAIDYKDGELHILDPFLAFYLRHGQWTLPELPTA
jgi:hypothetical protein